MLGVCLRLAFVQQYERDILEDFRGAVLEQLSEKQAKKLPATPPKGNLDLQQVIKSDFFFA